MHFLLKIVLEEGIWRLDALDGRADLAHTANLITASFGYKSGRNFFEKNGERVGAGANGQPDSHEAMSSFEEWLGDCSEGAYIHIFDNGVELIHRFKVMKREEKLFCLMPSVIVGAGRVPECAVSGIDEIRAFADRDENLTLDIRAATSVMRALGSVRTDVNAAMGDAGAMPLNFKSF